MILLDTNVLVAAVDPRDAYHDSVKGRIDKLSRRGLYVTFPVIAETMHFLASPPLRLRLTALITEAPLRSLPFKSYPDLDSILEWMNKYSEHEPDFVDAFLVVATAMSKKVLVWTNDSEFTTIWRRPDGSRVPLAG